MDPSIDQKSDMQTSSEEYELIEDIHENAPSI